MATRLYFPETQAAPVTPPAPSGTDWAHNNGVTRELQRASLADTSALTTSAYAPDGADHLVNGNACHRQYVSGPLEAQQISGTVKAQFQGLEANAGNNLFLTLKILVCNRAGSSTAATPLTITRTAVSEFATSLANRSFASTAISTYTCAAGDRLVVEVGYGGLPVAAGGVQGHNASLRFGCSAAGGDLAENNTDTGTTTRPWIEFSDDLQWERTAADGASPADTVDQQNAAVAGTSAVQGGTGGAGESDQATSQTFVPSVTGPLTRVVLTMSRFGTVSDQVQVSVRLASPTGTLLATSNPASIAPGPASVTFTFPSEVMLTSGVSYSLVVERTGARDASNYYAVSISSTSAYASGGMQARANNTWGSVSSTSDLAFATYRGHTVVLGVGEAVEGAGPPNPVTGVGIYSPRSNPQQIVQGWG